MITATTGERIRQARERLDLTQDQLAKACGVSRSAVSQWETGGILRIEAAKLNAAARRLGVTLDWLLFGSEASTGERVAEGRDIYQPVTATNIQDFWPLLTKTQQADLVQRAQDMADMNARILEELGRK
jgi:transcriptional regulator with XRE-family HTH domain